MSFNRLGTIFHKFLDRTGFFASQPRFHVIHHSSRSFPSFLYHARNPQQPSKRSFHPSVIQSGMPEEKNDYTNVSRTTFCSSRVQKSLRSVRAPNDVMPCDVTICIEGTEKTKAETFKAHKFVLGLFSGRFRQMWSADVQHKPDESDNSIRFSNVEPREFALMLRYMYADDTSDVTMENALDLLSCANFFQADKLTQICRDVIEISLTSGNACHIFRRARLMNEERMAKLTLSVICKSPDGAFASPEFLQLSPADLKGILERNDLNMPEPVIYQHVCRWALHRMCQPENNATNFRDTIGDLRFAIRFPLFDEELLESGPLKDGVITQQELDESASSATSVSDPCQRFPSTPRLPAPTPFYMSCQIGCDAFGKDQADSTTKSVVLELYPEFAPQTCAYARRVLELSEIPDIWSNIRLVYCDGFFLDASTSDYTVTLEPSERVATETSILSRTVPGAVCFGWEDNHCILDRARGFKQHTGEPEYAIWLASEKPDGGAVFGRVIHGLQLLKSAYGHFLAGDVANSPLTYWIENWRLHDRFPARLDKYGHMEDDAY